MVGRGYWGEFIAGAGWGVDLHELYSGMVVPESCITYTVCNVDNKTFCDRVLTNHVGCRSVILLPIQVNDLWPLAKEIYPWLFELWIGDSANLPSHWLVAIRQRGSSSWRDKWWIVGPVIGTRQWLVVTYQGIVSLFGLWISLVTCTCFWGPYVSQKRVLVSLIMTWRLSAIPGQWPWNMQMYVYVSMTRTWYYSTMSIYWPSRICFACDLL